MASIDNSTFDDNNWCGLDLDNVCGEDPKLIEAEVKESESPSPRDRAIEKSSPSRDNIRTSKSADHVRSSKSGDYSEKMKSKRRNSSKEGKKEDAPASTRASLLPFNLSFANKDKKQKQPKGRYLKQEKKDSVTDSDTDEENQKRKLDRSRDIQADVFMISGCEDSQTSVDVSNVSTFSLPNPNGRAGGACTSALLKVLYSNKSTVSNLTFVQVLSKMRKILRTGRYSQVPQLTSAQKMNVSQRFYIVPPNCQGTRRAVLIGINYVGQDGQLSGCHNDCLNMKDYIMNAWGFQEENITVLMDDGYHPRPTRSNILNAYKDVAANSKSGDAVFCHYSGHGGRVRDDDYGEEEDGYDETLVPVDYSTAGQIRDDDLYTDLVCAMASGVTLVSLMDCCHSATVLDLPHKYRASGRSEFQIDPLSLDGGNAMITAFLCGIIVVILVVVLPIMLVN